MEDLRDETLAKISTPKRDAGDSPVSRPKNRAKASADDTEISRHLKSNACADNAGQEEEEGTRRMFDKRELRKRHKDIFANQLALWREQHLHERPPVGQNCDRVQVCVRKRPLFDHERAVDEFDVISVRGSSEVVVHNCLTKADLRSLFVSHMGFRFSSVFSEMSSDDQVYANCAAPAVEHVLRGGVASLFMFGQTGSGKTHTMSGLLQRAAQQLFEGEKSNCTPTHVDDSEDALCQAPLALTAFEIAGRGMRDLLDTSNPSKELKIMEDKEHRTHVVGASSRGVHSVEDLLSLVENAQAHRATRATQVNDTSSRSHAVYRIWLGGSHASNAVLTLVDCAGSERKEDTTKHDLQSRKDAAEINSTIFALKECFRVMRSSKGQSPPYRESILTRVLSDSFSSDHALIVAIGTVSPSATDTEHSVGTLRSLQQLQGTSMAFETREDVNLGKSTAPHPRTWSEDEVRQWMEIAAGGRAKAHVAAMTKGTDGKNLVRWPIQRFVQLCGGDEDLGGRIYADLRQRIKGGGAAGS
jgi:kinesin family protein 2/24